MFDVERFIYDLGERYENEIIAGFIGSQSGTEKDLFVIGKENSFLLFPSTIESFGRAFRETFELYCPQSNVFLLDLHKGVATAKGKLLLHLLYYPSLAFFGNWELPSLTAYIYENAKFVFGEPRLLKPYYDLYISRKSVSFGMTDLHLAKYSNLAVNYYLYLIINVQTSIKAPEVFEKIAYATRFTLTELRVGKIDPKLEKVILNWSDWFDLKSDLEVSGVDALQHIEYLRKHRDRINNEEIRKLFLAYCEIHNKYVKHYIQAQ